MVKEKDLFFISSAWNTGTGFLVKNYNFIVTTIHVVGFSKNVVVRNPQIGKHIAEVIFIDYSNGLVFVELPQAVETSLSIENFELTVAEQPIKIYRTNYYGKIITENGEILDSKFIYNDFKYLELKTKHDIKSAGALILTNRKEIAGITKYIESEDLYFGLSSKYILNSLDEFSMINQPAIRCPNCFNIITKSSIINNVCPSCITNVKIELIENCLPEMTDFEQNIEKTISNLGYKVENLRLGRNFWEIEENSTTIFIRYEPKQKFIVAFSKLSGIVEDSYSEISKYLLVENDKLKYLSFSIHNNCVYLSASYLFEDNFDEKYAQLVFNELLEKANFYNNIIEKMIKENFNNG